MRRYPLLSTVLLIAALVLVACPAPATAPATGGQEAAQPAAGGEEAAQAEEEMPKVIRIGAAVSETGKYAREGEDTRQGYILWMEWVNNEYGGIKVGDERYQVELILYDDESNPDTVTRLTEKLITEDKVQFLLGPYSSGLTKAASAISEKYKIIMVEGNGASDSLFERGFQYLFAVLTPASRYTQSGLKALADAGAKSAVIAYKDSPFPKSVAQGAEQWAQEYGMEVLAVESYPADINDATALMTKFKELDPDVFVGAGHFVDGVLLARNAEEVDFTPKAFMLTVGPSNPEFVEELGKTSEQIIGPTQWERNMAWEGPYLGTAEEYAQRYEERWGEPPTYQAAESTATALALQIAIEMAGTLETDAVRQALLDMDVVTFYGPINFDETGKNLAKPMGAIQIQNGEILVIAPEEAAVAELVYPMTPWKER